MLRRWRLGNNIPDGNVEDLFSVILRAMNDYINTHSITWDDVELATDDLHLLVMENRANKRISETDSENTPAAIGRKKENLCN